MRTEYNHVHYSVNNRVCLTENERGCIFSYMTYGERLEKAMKHAGLTQSGLADAVGKDKNEKPRVTQANISKIITNPKNTGSKHTAKFARICGVSEDWLAYEDGEMFDGIYVSDEKLKRMVMIAQDLPDYAKDRAIKKLADIAEFVEESESSHKAKK